MLEALGYDITLIYTTRATDAKPDLDELLKQR